MFKNKFTSCDKSIFPVTRGFAKTAFHLFLVEIELPIYATFL